MIEKSRTEYSAKNTTVAMVARVAAILAGFITRVVFTHTLSEDYVGINGLFTDILNVLALSELGVGTAITYALYKPISEKDVEKQKSLMKLYQRFYRGIAVIVLIAGLAVIPFMDILIRNQPAVEHLILIYLMYLFNSVLSYLFIYKKTLIEAHQLSYIGVLYQTFFLLLQNVLQMGVLYFTRNFILFVAIMIGCTIANNLCVSLKADRMYPYLKERDVVPLSKTEKSSIYQNVRAMLMHKIGNVIVNNTDNLLLSSLVGIGSVSRYSNYFLIIGSVRQVLNQMFQGITASVGNLGVEESKERIKRIFTASFFIGQWMFGLSAICLYEVLDTFVEISFGAGYVFPKEVTLILCINFYVVGMRQATLVFRDSLGLFWYDRHKSLVEALINLISSLILGTVMGTLGIFLGTLISTVTTSLWVEPYILYKYRLEARVGSYFAKYGVYAGVTALLWYGEDQLCQRITGSLWFCCFGRFAVCFFITNLVYLVLYCRTKEFRLLWYKALELLRKKLSFGETKERKQRNTVNQEEMYLLAMLCNALQGEGVQKERNELKEAMREGASYIQWEKLKMTAAAHGVLSLLYREIPEHLAESAKLREEAQKAAKKSAMQCYHLLFHSKYMIEKLEAAGLSVVLLKGVGTASYYPEPELRKSGDVDLLLLDKNKAELACKVLEDCGCIVKERQYALHHVVLISPEGIDIELHTMLAEPFDNEKINKYMEHKLSECKEKICRKDVCGVELPVLSPDFYAYELLLHMLQHFLRSGFGLRFLCDWVVFWEQEMEDSYKEQYLCLVEESGIRGFSDMITQICCTYLGLKKDAVAWMQPWKEYELTEFMKEILEAEEFGKSNSDRMVVLRSNGISGYVREFHHQMRLNFPRYGKCCVLWPLLWIITLVRFLSNNRKIRKVSSGSIFRKAGQRSRLLMQIRLWK